MLFDIDLYCLNQDLRMYRMWFGVYISGFLDLIFCLNQDIQDLRMYRMWFGVYILGFLDLIFLKENSYLSLSSLIIPISISSIINLKIN